MEKKEMVCKDCQFKKEKKCSKSDSFVPRKKLACGDFKRK